MYKTAVVATLSLLSVLGPASAHEHWHKRHAHPAKVVVTEMKTVVVEAGQSTPAPSPVNQPVVNHAANNNNNPAPPAKSSSINYNPAPPAKSSSSTKAAAPLTSAKSTASYPSPTGSTGSGNNPGQGVGGTITFHNKCDFDVWLWISNGLPTGQREIGMIAKGKSYQEPKPLPACDGCGTCWKVSATAKLIKGFTSQFELSNNLTTTQQFNDISFVDCTDEEAPDAQKAHNCPGWSHGLQIKSPSTCGSKEKHCAAGTYCPQEAYYVDTPVSKMGLEEPNYTCGQNSNLLDTDFILCSDNKSGSKRSIAGRVEMDASL